MVSLRPACRSGSRMRPARHFCSPASPCPRRPLDLPASQVGRSAHRRGAGRNRELDRLCSRRARVREQLFVLWPWQQRRCQLQTGLRDRGDPDLGLLRGRAVVQLPAQASEELSPNPLVRCVAASVDDVSLFGQRGLLVEIVVAVQVGNIASNNDPFGVLPRPFADALARVDRRRARGRTRAKIRTPGVIPRAGGGGQRLAMLVRAREPAEIRALPEPALVTKKVIGDCCACATPPQPKTSSAIAADLPNRRMVIASSVCWSSRQPILLHTQACGVWPRLHIVRRRASAVKAAMAVSCPGGTFRAEAVDALPAASSRGLRGKRCKKSCKPCARWKLIQPTPCESDPPRGSGPPSSAWLSRWGRPRNAPPWPPSPSPSTSLRYGRRCKTIRCSLFLGSPSPIFRRISRRARVTFFRRSRSSVSTSC